MAMTTLDYRHRVKRVLKELISMNVERILYVCNVEDDSFEDWDLLADELRDLASDMFCDAYRIAAYAGNAQKRAKKETINELSRTGEAKSA